MSPWVGRVSESLTGSIKIYATSEERKQRNRQAQAAFRERRTEYIKQLETTIKHHEDTLQSVQQGHRSSNDECVMLRYKVSMYERILHERGKPSWSARALPHAAALSVVGKIVALTKITNC